MTDRAVRDARFYDLAMAVRVLSTFSQEDWDSLTPQQQTQLFRMAARIHYDYASNLLAQQDYCLTCMAIIWEPDFPTHAKTLAHQRAHGQALAEIVRSLNDRKE